MNNAIQYCISDHTSAQARVPLRYLVLSAEDRWPLIVSLLEYFQEILDLSFRRYVQKLFIYDQYMVVCKLSNCAAYASSGLLCKIEHFKQIRHPYISAPVQMPAGFLCKSTGHVSLTCTCEAIYDYVPGSLYEASCRHQKDLFFIQTSAIIIDRMYIRIRITKLGIPHQPPGSVVILACIAVVNDQIKSPVKRHRGIFFSMKLLMIKRFNECLKPEFAEFTAGFITDHYDHLPRNNLLHGHMRLVPLRWNDSPEAAGDLFVHGQGYLDCCSVRP